MTVSKHIGLFGSPSRHESLDSGRAMPVHEVQLIHMRRAHQRVLDIQNLKRESSLAHSSCIAFTLLDGLLILPLLNNKYVYW